MTNSESNEFTKYVSPILLYIFWKYKIKYLTSFKVFFQTTWHLVLLSYFYIRAGTNIWERGKRTTIKNYCSSIFISLILIFILDIQLRAWMFLYLLKIKRNWNFKGMRGRMYKFHNDNLYSSERGRGKKASGNSYHNWSLDIAWRWYTGKSVMYSC